MFRFLRGLFEKEEKLFTLTVREAGGWLDGRERELEEELRTKSAETRATVVDRLEGLDEVLRDLEGAEGREDIHPKLRSVTDRSLPLFIPAMRQQIARPMPEDPDAFYAAATDLLAFLLKIQKGQGRYLSGVFPEEMKEVKHLTAGIGRSINEFTGTVKEVRAAQERIDGARAALDDLLQAQEDVQSSRAAIPDLKSRISQAEAMIAAKEELVRVLRDDTAYLRCLELREQVKTISGEVEMAGQILQNLGARLARVLRKSERIAARSGEKADVKALDGCIALLDDPVAAGSDAVLAALPAAAGLVRAQIAHGDLTLKGKDDLMLFSEDDRIEQAFLDAFGRYSSVQAQLLAVQKEVRSCSLPGEIEGLEEEIRALTSGITADRENLQIKEEEIHLFEESVPACARRLREALELVAGRPLSLEGEGFVIAAETKTAQSR
ncbi:MAG: hypothetical protein PWP08_1825 [Methanofollis sp.]|nr:hypothetical protein [Methanofollis sp.]